MNTYQMSADDLPIEVDEAVQRRLISLLRIQAGNPDGPADGDAICSPPFKKLFIYRDDTP